MNNNLNFLFGMYEPATDSIIANIDENTILVIRCKECNSSVIFDDPNDVVYLYRLAMETPLLYILPFFGNKPINEIKASDVRSL